MGTLCETHLGNFDKMTQDFCTDSQGPGGQKLPHQPKAYLEINQRR